MEKEIKPENLFHKENKISNQEHFERNKDLFSNQCAIVYQALIRGEKLTTSIALIKYGVGDLRRRVKDLIDTWNVDVQSKYIEGRYKEYFLILNE